MDSITKITRILLAAAFLIAVAGRTALASPVIYNEGTALVTFPPVVNLAGASNPGMTIVNGTQNQQPSELELSGLGSGTFVITATSDGTIGDFIRVYNSSCFAGACFIESNSFDSVSPASLMPEPIPASGDLFVLIQPNGAEGNDFSITVTTSGGGTSSVPEPSTAALAGLGLTAALALVASGRGRRATSWPTVSPHAR